MKKRIFGVNCLLFISLVLLVYGCGDLILSGKDFGYSSVPMIEKGKSTQQDIQKKIGEPISARKTETGEVWNYYVTGQGAFTTFYRSLDIYFNKSGVVTDYTYKEK